MTSSEDDEMDAYMINDGDGNEDDVCDPLPQPKPVHGGCNSGNAKKHKKTVDQINSLVDEHYMLNENEGKFFALCPICNGALKLGRITGFGRAIANCTVIQREKNPHGGDLNITATRKAGAIKRMLQSHLDSDLHRHCAGLATAHRDLKRARATELSSSDVLLGRLFRTALQVVGEYGSFLSFAKWVRLQDLNGCDIGNRNHSEFTMREMVVCTAELWLGGGP